MPARHFRKHLLDRISKDLRAAGELGLAFLMTAGVASCGGSVEPTGEPGTTDAGAQGSHTSGAQSHATSSTSPTYVVEAASSESTSFVEAASEGTTSESTSFVEAASSSSPPQDAGHHHHPRDGGFFEAASFEGGMGFEGVEAASFPDGGDSGH